MRLEEAQHRRASKQILHLDITLRASSETLLRWGSLICINPTLRTAFTERRHQHALLPESKGLHGERPPVSQAVALLFTCSTPGTASHRDLGGLLERHSSSLFPQGKGTNLRCSGCPAPGGHGQDGATSPTCQRLAPGSVCQEPAFVSLHSWKVFRAGWN